MAAPLETMACSVARTLDVVGDRWTMLILRDIGLGITRFDALQSDLGISRKVLSERLAALVEREVVGRSPYQQKPSRYDYHLTEKGSELAVVLFAMMAWGDRWGYGEGAEPIHLRHARCGEIATPTLSCSECGEPLNAWEVAPVTGPGLDTAGSPSEVEAAKRRLERFAAATAP
jgi:DNA-binding HxlR family transcriptional regulator